MKWVGTQFPTQATQDAEMSLAEYEDLSFRGRYTSKTRSRRGRRSEPRQHASSTTSDPQEAALVDRASTLTVRVRRRTWLNAAGNTIP